ncbi:endonuclease domain-containing protein [Alsobacter sp. R-9]
MANRPSLATSRARALRRTMTDTERRLWHRLRDRRLAGFKFVRQEPVAGFIADFCCREARLIVEADGSQHAESTRDLHRDAALRRAGFRVLRFWNHEILHETDAVIDTIFAALHQRS